MHTETAVRNPASASTTCVDASDERIDTLCGHAATENEVVDTICGDHVCSDCFGSHVLDCAECANEVIRCAD